MPPAADQVLGRVALLTGPAEFLTERSVQRIKAAARAADPEVEISDADAAEVTSIDDVAAPSLFSSVRCVIIRGLENLPDAAAEGLLTYAAEPADDVALVLVHSGGQKGSGLLTKLRKLPAVTESVAAAPKPRDFATFVTGEVKAAGGRIDARAADFLIEAVGQDLRSLAAAASQLVNDCPGQAITEDVVRQYFSGRADVKAYAIADVILAGQRAKAIEELRWSLNSGGSVVYILATVAGQARSIANHVAGRRDRGMPDWKARQIGQQARGWSEGGIGRALQVIASAEADAKGNAVDGTYTLERLVLTLASLRER